MTRGVASTCQARLERLPDWLRSYVIPQRRDEYTEEAHAVWRDFFAQYTKNTRELAHRIYGPHLAGLESLRLDPDEVPSIEWLCERLAPTSWMTVCVDGYLPVQIYAAFIARKIFPVSREIRRAEHIQYAPTPDLAHDVFGHLPLLFDPTHRTYLCELGRVTASAAPSELDNLLHLAYRKMGRLRADPESSTELVQAAELEIARIQVRLAETPSRIAELSRLFLWSIEFGLIGTTSNYLVQGAGLLSSPAETASLFTADVNVKRYSMDVTQRDILFSDFQRQYYVFADYAELSCVLQQYAAKGSR